MEAKVKTLANKVRSLEDIEAIKKAAEGLRILPGALDGRRPH
jgi:hypothetical protein